jgi:NAD(P)H-dependent FMN reductase
VIDAAREKREQAGSRCRGYWRARSSAGLLSSRDAIGEESANAGLDATGRFLALSGSMIRLLALSGSLRRASSNTFLLQAAAMVAPSDVEVCFYEGLGGLPPFNPDCDQDGQTPVAVLDFRLRLKAADGILISSPEYAHGVSGVLKNALDWIVGSGEFSSRPVALFNASPRASLAHASLVEIIRTMDARLVPEASVALPLLGRKLDATAIASDPEMAAALRASLAAFARAIATKPAKTIG